MLFVTESWQSGNAPDSKSGEPSFSLARRFKSCTLLLFCSVIAAITGFYAEEVFQRCPSSNLKK